MSIYTAIYSADTVLYFKGKTTFVRQPGAAEVELDINSEVRSGQTKE